MVLRERPSSGRGHDDDSGREPDGHAARRLMARRGVVGVLAGALIMLLAASAVAATGGSLGFLGLASDDSPSVLGGSSSGEVTDRAQLASAPGTCLTWSAADGSDVSEVPCAQSHLFENVGPVNAPLPEGAPFPPDAAWQDLVAAQCAPRAQAYLGGPLDPTGRYKVGALKPTAEAWEDGDRTVRCGLQAPGRTGALFSSEGRVADADQAVVFDPGTCLGLDGKEVSDPVADCSRTHAAEVAGTADLARQFPDGLPSVDDQDNWLQPECTRIAREAVGEQRLADSRLTVYWTNVGEESWDAGTRRVSCNMGALLPDGSGFAPLTGSVANGVTVGGEAPATPEPLPSAGAPAVQPSSPAAGGGQSVAPATPAPGGASPAPNGGLPQLPVPPLLGGS